MIATSGLQRINVNEMCCFVKKNVWNVNKVYYFVNEMYWTLERRFLW